MICGRQRAGQDQPARGGRLGRDRASRSGACPTPRWCAPGASRRSCAPRWSTTSGVQLLEAEIRASGRNRVQLNRSPCSGRATCSGSCGSRCSRPTTSQLVKGGPAGRRDYLDDLLVALSPRYDAARADYERVLKQRNALLRGGLRGEDAVGTLDVFDLQLAAAGAELARGRLQLLERLVPGGGRGLRRARRRAHPDHRRRYEAEWAAGGLGGMAVSTATCRPRCSTRSRRTARPRSTGGHARRARTATSGGCSSAGSRAAPTRRRASSARSRSRCGSAATGCAASSPAARRCCCSTTCSASSTTSAPVALVAHLDAGQTLVTTAGTVPRGISADRMLRVDAGRRGSGVSDEPSARRGEPDPAARTRVTSRSRSSRRAGDGRRRARARAERRARHPRRRAGARSSAPTSPRTRGSSRCATAPSRWSVDDPIWATQLRYLEPAIVTRATALARARCGRRGCGCAWASRARPTPAAKSAGTPPNSGAPSGTLTRS